MEAPFLPRFLDDRMAHYVHYFTLHGALRPFGASCLVGGYDEVTQTPCFTWWNPLALRIPIMPVLPARDKQPAKTELEKLDLQQDSHYLEEAVKQICRIIYMLHDEKQG